MKNLLNITDATKELNILRSKRGFKRPFEVVGSYRLIDDGQRPEATVIIRAERREMHEASTGVGPVDALANVLKKSLSSIFPAIQEVKLVDFSSRIHDSRSGTSAGVEVNIIFSDGEAVWSVVAISENINRASFLALIDGFEYAILAKKATIASRNI
ncbi:MAG: alpha-isopropylmalate synthase regulatory domain-containing protein [Syntrophorhabdaceae bacterium]|nr:alpha-isopropylmalate synthase regulatory domain-containing protein [Syntrophorhabdaceae bacterium]